MQGHAHSETDLASRWCYDGNFRLLFWLMDWIRCKDLVTLCTFSFWPTYITLLPLRHVQPTATSQSAAHVIEWHIRDSRYQCLRMISVPTWVIGRGFRLEFAVLLVHRRNVSDRARRPSISITTRNELQITNRRLMARSVLFKASETQDLFIHSLLCEQVKGSRVHPVSDFLAVASVFGVISE